MKGESRAFRKISDLAFEKTEDTIHPPRACATCGKRLDCSSGDAGAKPVPGALSICAYCGAFAQYDDALELRPLSAAEFAALPADVRSLMEETRDLLEETRDLLRAARLGLRPGVEA